MGSVSICRTIFDLSHGNGRGDRANIEIAVHPVSLVTTANFNPKTAPGHQILAAAGKTILRPGGKSATQQLFQWANFQPGDTVLELASSFGESAIALARNFGVSVVGVERNPDSVRRATENVRQAGLTDRITFYEGSIFDLDEISDRFDFVLAEAILTMQSQPGKAKLLRSIRDRLNPGGVFLSQESCLITPNPDASQALSQTLRVNAQPLTPQEWENLCLDAGFIVQYRQAGDMELLDLPRLVEDEGWGRTLKIAWNLATQPELRDRTLEMRQTFHQYRDSLGFWIMKANRTE